VEGTLRVRRMPSNERCVRARGWTTTGDARAVMVMVMSRWRFLKDWTRAVDAWTKEGRGWGKETVEMCVCG